ncbi:MAG: single-stranded-DNA-specific exonuclease RecJ [Eubacteriales bacterium]
MIVKYGTWSVAGYDQSVAVTLEQLGFSPLTAAILSSRGYDTPDKALDFLQADATFADPFLMTDMDIAVERISAAIASGEKIAVFGDYDVDGITSTCLLTEFLLARGAVCVPYIPHRMEDGYGLSTPAIDTLSAEGVKLIVTVDCGITATDEAEYCHQKGIDLVITDHHECKSALPRAIAVVDTHRTDCNYPHKDLAGVGVAFKLAAALAGSQDAVLNQFADLVCLGTVADVMPLTGENRLFVKAGLTALTLRPRLGLAALMVQCGCEKQAVTSSTIGYTLAPRINAAGRMGSVGLAVDLFLTRDKAKAEELAKALCNLNRERQSVEANIFAEAVTKLHDNKTPSAIVLSGETWHQGVVGIVASRLAEEYGCPTFLVCMDDDHGKASSRSYGGFNLFHALESNEELLESYGGHELAAGFTIHRDCIDQFREKVCQMADEFRKTDSYQAALHLDCQVEPNLLTLPNIESLEQLEPCGSGCPKPTLYMNHLTVEQLSEVGGGKHLRLKLRRDGFVMSCIFFSTTALRAAIGQGDLVEIAFTPQINEYRGNRSVQLNLVDIRPMAKARQRSREEQDVYTRHLGGQDLSPAEVDNLIPRRPEFVAVWRYLTANATAGNLQDSCDCLSRKISRFAGIPASGMRTRICLDVFAEQQLIALEELGHTLHITLLNPKQKVDLEQSAILRQLKQRKAGG